MDKMSLYANFLTDGELSRLLMRGISKIHFIGILGAGMLPLAKLTHSLGYAVTGSDAKVSEPELHDGLYVTPHTADNLADKELIVASFAIARDNPELSCAIERALPTVYRAQLLGALMKAYGARIGVSGSHGKSTTTAIIDKIFSDAGMHPTTVSGATLFDGRDIRLGEDGYFIYEACEYKDAFLHFSPTTQVITGIELDHTDYFDSLDSIVESFKKSIKGAERVVLNRDFDRAGELLEAIGCEVITYGVSHLADYRYSVTEKRDGRCRFSILKRGEVLLDTETSLIGDYNLLNMLAAAAVADSYGIDKEIIARSVKDFPGIERRMSRLGKRGELDVFYDYAHHPTEIALAIGALKEHYGSCTVIFRPHTYSRTKSLWDGFISAFCKADFTILLDIYPAREEAIEGVTSENLARDIGDSAVFAKPSEVARLIDERALGAVVVMGAGDVADICKELIDKP